MSLLNDMLNVLNVAAWQKEERREVPGRPQHVRQSSDAVSAVVVAARGVERGAVAGIQAVGAISQWYEHQVSKA